MDNKETRRDCALAAFALVNVDGGSAGTSLLSSAVIDRDELLDLLQASSRMHFTSILYTRSACLCSLLSEIRSYSELGLAAQRGGQRLPLPWS